MKKLLLLLSITVSLNSFSQDFMVENNNHYQVLYRGFKNMVSIGQVGSEMEGVEIQSINCEVQKSPNAENENNYVIMTRSSAKTAKIIFVANGQALDSTEFLLQNLPTPYLYWGNQRSETVSSNSNELQLKYTSEVLLKTEFIIDGWEFMHGDQTFTGEGNLLSEDVMNHLNSIESGEVVWIIADVIDEVGITRKMSGSWSMQ